jgi:hypothetical protein
MAMKKDIGASKKENWPSEGMKDKAQKKGAGHPPATGEPPNSKVSHSVKTSVCETSWPRSRNLM